MGVKISQLPDISESSLDVIIGGDLPYNRRDASTETGYETVKVAAKKLITDVVLDQLGLSVADGAVCVTFDDTGTLI